jgi:hypothetical protein
MTPFVTMRRALSDGHLLGGALGDDSWLAWRVLLIAAMGEALTRCAWRLPAAAASGVSYLGFVDPSGGASDAMTLAIAHRVGDRVVYGGYLDKISVFQIKARVNLRQWPSVCAAYGQFEQARPRVRGARVRESGWWRHVSARGAGLGLIVAPGWAG